MEITRDPDGGAQLAYRCPTPTGFRTTEVHMTPEAVKAGALDIEIQIAIRLGAEP